MRRSFAVLLAAALAAGTAGVATASRAAAPQAPTGFWMAGDLHVHTIYGHDTCITPTTAWDPASPDRGARRPCEDPYTVGFQPRERLREADMRGLNFVALTDHNNVVNQTDPAARSWLAGHPYFVAIPAY